MVATVKRGCSPQIYASKSGLLAGAIIEKLSMGYLCKMLRCAIKEGFLSARLLTIPSADGLALTFQSVSLDLSPMNISAINYAFRRMEHRAILNTLDIFEDNTY